METTVLSARMRAEDVRVSIGDKSLLNGVSLELKHNEILSIIGPAGSGKTTFLRCLNRLIDLEEGLAIKGRIFLGSQDIYATTSDLSVLRQKVSMVFAVPSPLPMSIRDNLTLGLRFKGFSNRREIEERIEKSLRAAFLWEEVKDRQNDSGLKLSGGQQQRLCLARSLMVNPEVLLLDEPCSGLDPISTAKIEEALQGLKEQMSVILVTNNVKQASRTSDRTAFLLMGDLVEIDETAKIFTNPKDTRTGDYVSGRFG